MLSHDDRDRLAEIEHRLSAEDPAFAARMRTSGRPRMPVSMIVVMTVLGVTVPVLAAVAGWTTAGAVLLVIAVVATGWRLHRRVTRRPRTAPS